MQKQKKISKHNYLNEYCGIQLKPKMDVFVVVV